MDFDALLGSLLGGVLGDFTGNIATTPTIQSITEAKEKNNQGILVGTWDNINSSFILIALTIIGALALNYKCYGRDKRIWIDDCILNQIIFIILISLLFNVESKVIPSSVSASSSRGTSRSESETLVQTPTSSPTSNTSTANSDLLGEAAAIVSSEPVVVEVISS